MRALFVLPFAKFDAPRWLHEALERRALATINGACACGATYERSELRPGELHTPAMLHEDACPAADPRLGAQRCSRSGSSYTRSASSCRTRRQRDFSRRPPEWGSRVATALVNDPAPLHTAGVRQRRSSPDATPILLTPEAWLTPHGAAGAGAMKDKGYRATPIGGEVGRFMRSMRWSDRTQNTLDTYEIVLSRLALDFAHFTSLEEFTTDDAARLPRRALGRLRAGDATQPARDRQVVLPLLRRRARARSEPGRQDQAAEAGERRAAGVCAGHDRAAAHGAADTARADRGPAPRPSRATQERAAAPQGRRLRPRHRARSSSTARAARSW